jgi:hypothetical protein
MFRQVLLLLFALWSFAPVMHAQSRRLALIVGNQNYRDKQLATLNPSLNDDHMFCHSDDLLAAHAFGDLEARLNAQGVHTTFLATCSFSGNPSIEDLGNALGQLIGNLNVPQVDIVSHSMGGLMVRSHLSGKQPSGKGFQPPLDPKVRKWISIATPNFGALIPPQLAPFLPDMESRQITPGSQFLFDLATWNQIHDDLRGIDAIGMTGNAEGIGPLQGTSDETRKVKELKLLEFTGGCRMRGQFTKVGLNGT